MSTWLTRWWHSQRWGEAQLAHRCTRAARRSQSKRARPPARRGCASVRMHLRIREFCVCDVSVRVTEARLAVESISKKISVASAGVRVANLTLLTRVKIKQRGCLEILCQVESILILIRVES